MIEQLPRLALDIETMESNLRAMRSWHESNATALAPHIKTTMCRPIVERQLAAGAWGLTVATAAQASLAADWGAARIIVANNVVDAPSLRMLASLLARHHDVELLCFADSALGVSLLGAIAKEERRIGVLIDVGRPGGRSGVRSVAEAAALATEVARTQHLDLAGVSGYEGVGPNVRDSAHLAEVDRHCRMTVSAFAEVAEAVTRPAPIFSMGGSAFPDRVIDALEPVRRVSSAEIVLRSGCYVTHDHGTYAQVCPVPGLRPALTVHAIVVSQPEPGLAVIGAGKRELASDAGLPVLLGHASVSGRSARGTATKIFDHHLVLERVEGLQVGDEVVLGISHPCSAFDRWDSLVAVTADGAPERWPIDLRGGTL